MKKNERKEDSGARERRRPYPSKYESRGITARDQLLRRILDATTPTREVRPNGNSCVKRRSYTDHCVNIVRVTAGTFLRVPQVHMGSVSLLGKRNGALALKGKTEDG